MPLALPIEEPETPPTAKELRAAVKGLERQLSDSARRGDNHTVNTTMAELNTAKVQLRQAETRELAEAATAARLKNARTRSGMDEDGGMKTSGYATTGALIADRLRRGPVQVELERYLREAGINPPGAA